MNLRIDRTTLVAWGAFILCAVFVLAVTFDLSGSRLKREISLEPVRWAPQRAALADTPVREGIVNAGGASFFAPVQPCVGGET
jgi:hypothetical protein